MNFLAPEILDNIIDHIPKEEKKETLQSLSLVNKRLRNAANRRKFAQVNLSYGREIDDENPGVPRYLENVTSHTFKFLKLTQESVDIPQHIQTLTFSPVNGVRSNEPYPEGYEHYKEFASIPIIIAMAQNLRCISFPAGNYYDEAAYWDLDIPPILQNAFLEFYKNRGPNLYSKIDITGIRDFPAHLLCDIPNIDELCARPLVIEDVPVSSTASIVQGSIPSSASKVLKLRALGVEVPWGLGQCWEGVMQLFSPPSSFVNLGRLETLNISYYESHIAELNRVLQPCATTLNHIYLRIGSLSNGTTCLIDWDNGHIDDSDSNAVAPDFSCLQNLQTLTIVGLVYRNVNDRQTYKSQVPWLGELLSSLIQSSAFTATLREIHLCFTIGRIHASNLRYIDWSPITNVLEDNHAQSRLEQISFNFRIRDTYGLTNPLNQRMLDEVKNRHIRSLEHASGIVVVKSDIDFSAA
ncbi:hypothetical protein BJ165DRAFT_1549389 [Panaeolus papilionaceus]|nr:hypothetical protein BJ165DRAFT_1549389 [Panaeolus papilionaceus]